MDTNDTVNPDATTVAPKPRTAKPRTAKTPKRVALANVPAGFDAVHAALDAVRSHTDTTRPALALAVERALVAALRVRNATVPDSVRIGRFTGRGIMDFQNALFACNASDGWRFTDAALIVAWKLEFPNAKCDFIAHPDYIASTRTLVNAGKHGDGCGVHDYTAFDVNGNAVGTRRRPVAAPKTANG